MDHNEKLERLSCTALRMLAVDAIERARSGHPGVALGAATMMHVLWARVLKHDPCDPSWLDRDRFVLAVGHASILLYGLLHLSGYKLSLDELIRFRQLGSLTPGHPERGVTPGVEVTTGPLGQGLGMAVGLAMAEKRLARTFNQDGVVPLVDHFTYVLLSDGDMMEGVTYEAASLAGHFKLGKLIALYDDNKISIEGSTDLTFSEDIVGRFTSIGWHTVIVKDGESMVEIENALGKARAELDRPSLVIVNTHIGYGSPKQDSAECHGAPLGPQAAAATRGFFGWPEELFHVPEEVRHYWQEVGKRGRRERERWQIRFTEWQQKNPVVGRQFVERMEMNLGHTWREHLLAMTFVKGDHATRAISGKILNMLAGQISALWGGAADLGSSVCTDLIDEPERIIHFGVREHAMGAITNGLAAHGGFLPYCGTFLSFFNYMIPAIRLAAMMRLRVVYIFTHDSIAVGEDGPTHQPVEHLAQLRAIPGLVSIRPGDVWETRSAWRLALELPGPVALILTRQKVEWVDEEPVFVERGAYVRRDCIGEPELILISSGSELVLAQKCHALLNQEGIRTRLVSMPSWELFEQQTEEYREEILPFRVERRLAIEAATPMGWHRWVGIRGRIIGVEDFGVSGPFEEVIARFGFSMRNIMEVARSMVGGIGCHG
ncbi:MAG: transketolase [Magnetococcales bacterium]|nr:transketolase [Magnetococcales bacterium]